MCIVLFVYCVINFNFIYWKSSDDNVHEHAFQRLEEPLKIIDLAPVINDVNLVITDKIINKIKNDSVISSNGSNKRLLVYDAGGFGAVQQGITKCKDGLEFESTGDSSRLSESDVSIYHMQVPPKGNFNKPHYSMVFTLESEPHSYGGESWDNADFRMWYNLDMSLPEPATYFDVKVHLADLLSPPTVEFEKKTDEAPIVWIVSNCNAFNGREKYMQRLMSSVKVDSYGGCLKNKFTHTADRMKGNIELFSRYKFVIAIENSNCQDYITEKLVHAIGSGSIPIVAGKDDKPDYLKFIPKHSYINLYDYETPEKLAEHINKISKNKTLYETYIPFKRHSYTREHLTKLSLAELIELAKKIFDPSEKFMNELVAKEKSENKVCKIARYISNNDPETIKKEIDAKRRKRPSTAEACLSPGNLDADFKQPDLANKQEEKRKVENIPPIQIIESNNTNTTNRTIVE